MATEKLSTIDLSSSLLMEWNVDIAKKPQPQPHAVLSPRLDRSTIYRVFKYREFSSKIKCFICNTREKAGRTVAIRNESTLEEFDAGLDCLRKHFSITKEQLKDQVVHLRLLIKYWLNFVNKAVASPVFYKTSDAALISMADFIADAASFDCTALREASFLLRELQNNLGLVNDGYRETEVHSLQSLIALQYDHRYAPEVFYDRKRELLEHPKILPVEKAFVEAFYKDLAGVTLTDITRLQTTIRDVTSRSLPIKLVEFSPYNYPDQSVYRESVLRAMKHRAMTVSETQRRYHDTKYRSRADAVANSLKEVKQRGWITLSLADTDRDNLVLYDLPPFLEQQLKSEGISYFLSLTTQAYERSSIQLDTDAITRKRQRASDEERNEPLKGYFRGLSLWRVDPWYGAYGVWFKHSDNEGKRLFQSLTSLVSRDS